MAGLKNPIDLFSYVCKLPIVDHVMLSREFFLYVSENYSFIFTRICLNLKEIILKGTITWSTLGKQTNEAKEVYWGPSLRSLLSDSCGCFFFLFPTGAGLYNSLNLVSISVCFPFQNSLCRTISFATSVFKIQPTNFCTRQKDKKLIYLHLLI